MSLVGNLEDLGLGDILQIVSLSRKSGVLALHSRGREGRVYFRNGQVIRATSSAFKENLGDLLVRNGIVTLETLRAALAFQQQCDPQPRLGSILSQKFNILDDAIENVVRVQIEKIVYSFFGWNEGTFAFELGEPGDMNGTSLNPLQFMLDQGLNPQWLAMEGSRIYDEKRHRGESFEEEALESLVDEDSLLAESRESAAPLEEESIVGAVDASSTTARGDIFILDDDPVILDQLGKNFKKRGFEVRTFASGKDFMGALEVAVAEGDAPALLIDLIMPRLDGTGILGGLEVVETIKRKYPQLDILMMSDHFNEETERRLIQLGVTRTAPKPKKTLIREPEGRKALELLAETVDTLLSDNFGHLPESPSLFNFGAELLEELGEESSTARIGRGPESPGLHLLKGMLQELGNPSLGGGIILLVLRFASELMNRAVIFLAKEKEIVGLGQFGIESADETADVKVRRMKIPRNEPSIFQRVLEERSAVKVQLGSGYWDDYLKEQLGGAEPEEIFLGPIVSEGMVVAILYGDNLPDQTPVGDTEALEIFLSQAGLAMEKTLLERRLRGKSAE